MPRTTDKRLRLIISAKKLISEKGFNETTLADIAEAANVPLGNVYYYFKTKESIGEAVIERHAAEQIDFFRQLDEHTTPKARLLALLQFTPESLESIGRFGSPIGGLCQELGKQGGSLADQAAKLLHDLLNWCETQFRSLGFGEKSTDHALYLVSSIEGAYLLTHTFKDPKLAIKEAKMLQDWLEKLTIGVKVAEMA